MALYLCRFTAAWLGMHSLVKPMLVDMCESPQGALQWWKLSYQQLVPKRLNQVSSCWHYHSWQKHVYPLTIAFVPPCHTAVFIYFWWPHRIIGIQTTAMGVCDMHVASLRSGCSVVKCALVQSRWERFVTSTSMGFEPQPLRKLTGYLKFSWSVTHVVKEGWVLFLPPCEVKLLLGGRYHPPDQANGADSPN